MPYSLKRFYFTLKNLVLWARSEREGSAVTCFFTEYWSDGVLEEKALRTAQPEVMAKQCFSKSQYTLMLLFMAFQYSTTPALQYSRKKVAINPLPGVTQSRALRTRILYPLNAVSTILNTSWSSKWKIDAAPVGQATEQAPQPLHKAS